MEEEWLSGETMRKIVAFIKKILISKYLSLAFRIYIGWLFIYASLTKIPDPAVFAESVAAYRIMPYWGINLVAIILPMVELISGFLLILGVRTKATASILSGLLFMYTIFTIVNVLRGSPITCGCYDVVGDPVNWRKVITDISYLLMTIQVYFFDRIYLFSMGGFVFKGKSLQ